MKLTKNILFVLFLSVLSLQACSKENVGYDQAYEMSVVDVPEEYAMAESDISADYSMAELKAPAHAQASIRFVAPQIADHKSNFIPTKAASAENDGDKKFIRTANLRFEVADVISATHAIEDIIIAKKGFIINSSMENKNMSLDETLVTKDSIQVTFESKLTGQLSLRVHNTLLDATLREIAPLAKYVHYRNVSANEVTFDIIANKLEQIRKKDKSNRVKAISGANKGHKLEDLLAAEEAIDESRSEADAAQIAEYELMDNIAYSTITISLWQEPTKTIKMKLNEAEVESYNPGFFSNMGDAIAVGWYDVLELATELVSIWPTLLILGAIAYGIVHVIKRRRKKNKVEE